MSNANEPLNLHERMNHLLIGAEVVGAVLDGDKTADEIKDELNLSDDELSEVRRTLNATYDHYA